MFRKIPTTAPAAPESTTHVEFAVQFVWADGHSEIRPADTRYDAENRARHHSEYRSDREATATAVTREVTVVTTGWAAI